MKSKKILMTETVMIGLLYLCVAFLIESAQWFRDTWDDMDFATVVYQLSTPLRGTNKEIIIDFCKFVIPTALFRGVGAACFFYFFTCIFSVIRINWNIKVFSKSLTVGLGRKFCMVGRCIFCLFIIMISVRGITAKVQELGIDSYVKSVKASSNIFEDYYVAPQDVKLDFPQQKRNLIFIYLESMETTYASVEYGGGKADNYIPELTKLANEYVSISNTEKMGGVYPCALTGWTIAALLGSTAGVPYKIPGDGNSADRYAQFLPGLTTLGDILEAAGYQNYFLCGSDAEFAGRDVYFKTHGSYEIKDYWYANENGLIPKDYYVFWGYEDEKLFDIAKQEITNAASGEKPFNFTMLTVDTHHNSGYVCELCENQYDEQFANVIACSSRQIYHFIEWIQEQEWYADTTVILLGDHNSMTADFWDDIGDYGRRTYNCFINLPEEADISNIKNRECTTLDMFPTTLAALGVKIEGDRLALGTNMFSESETLMEKIGKDTLDSELSKYSKYYFDNFVEKPE